MPSLNYFPGGEAIREFFEPAVKIPLNPPEGVKKSPYHPHPGPPPSRGREFLLVF